MDIERPNALRQMAAKVSNANRELVLLVCGPDHHSVQMARHALKSIESVGLRRHSLILTGTPSSCQKFPSDNCVWSSRVILNAPSNSALMKRYWDWRFRFYSAKKAYLLQLTDLGFSVLQADLDTVWKVNPFHLLRAMAPACMVVQQDSPFANAGLMYVRPGCHDPLADLAWRIQMFQNQPGVISAIVPNASRPFYSNCDDQTILNDVIVSTVINQTVFPSTLQYEGKTRHKPHGRGSTVNQSRSYYTATWRRAQRSWLHVDGVRVGYLYFDSPGGRIAIAPPRVFAHVPYTPDSAVTHLAAIRGGFREKLRYLETRNLWMGPPQPAGTVASPGAPLVRNPRQPM